MWITAETPPQLQPPQYEGEIVDSAPVLACDNHGTMFVAVYTKWEDCPAKWVTDCSGRWDLSDGQVTHWMPLPPLPTPATTQRI